MLTSPVTLPSRYIIEGARASSLHRIRKPIVGTAECPVKIELDFLTTAASGQIDEEESEVENAPKRRRTAPVIVVSDDEDDMQTGPFPNAATPHKQTR